LRKVWATTPKGTASKSKKGGSSSAKKKAATKANSTPALAKSETKPQKPVKDGQQYIKKEVLRELSEITSGMIGKAKDGGTAPLKLLWELGKLHEDATTKRKKREPSLGKLLLDEVRKKQAQQKSMSADADGEKQK
jgi:hypothetical protein